MPDDDVISFIEDLRLSNALAVDDDAVSAAAVFDTQFLVFSEDDCMNARNARVVEHKMAFGAASNHEFAFRRLNARIFISYTITFHFMESV